MVGLSRHISSDWDRAIGANHGLYRAPRVAFSAPAISLSNGLFQVQLNGDAGLGYAVDATTNFLRWTAIAATTNFAGAWQIQDSPLLPWRFYRARQVLN